MINSIEYKICSKCKINKLISFEFYRQAKYPSGKIYFKSQCRVCESLYQLEFIKKNGLKKTALQKEKFAIYKKQWREKNKYKENIKYKNKCINDISFRLRKNVSRAVNHMLKRKNSNKNGSIMKYLKYNMSDLKNHIEKQFDDKMSWNNYGSYWHIDHIIPQACLPYALMSDDNFIKCWSLNNLRPLEAKLNMLEGATRIRHKKFLMEKSDA